MPHLLVLDQPSQAFFPPDHRAKPSWAPTTATSC
ncbi:hypothetical protein AB6O49_00020 [Streptomyces sp. SBR177]